MEKFLDDYPLDMDIEDIDWSKSNANEILDRIYFFPHKNRTKIP